MTQYLQTVTRWHQRGDKEVIFLLNFEKLFFFLFTMDMMPTFDLQRDKLTVVQVQFLLINRKSQVKNRKFQNNDRKSVATNR